eukprot:10375393-Ditylum_brightwellii.AAC.1
MEYQKIKAITKGSLCPVTGDLNCRLDNSFSYLPLISSGSNKNTEPKMCQLTPGLHGKKGKAQINQQDTEREL